MEFIRRHRFWLCAALLFCISRLLFLTPMPIFFDSGEYLARLQTENYWTAIITGHIPLHAGYVIVFWPIFYFAKMLSLPPMTTVLIVQILLALLAVHVFAQIVLYLTRNRQIAWWSAILVSLTPLFWITNVTIMIETLAVTFLLMSTWATLKLSDMANQKSKQVKWGWASLASISFILAFLTQPFVMLWLPFLWLIAWQKKRFKNYRIQIELAGILGGSFLFASIINIFLIQQQLNAPWSIAFHYLFGSKLGEQAMFSWSLKTIAVYGRNFLIPLFRNVTPLIVILASFGLWQLLRQKKWLGWWCVVGILPAFVTNQWWDSLFAGRHALMVSFLLAFLTANLLKEHRRWLFIVALYLLIVSGYAVNLLRSTNPFLDQATVIANLPVDSLVIDSHYARPLTQTSYQGEMIFVNEPNWAGENLNQRIGKYLQQKKPVFVTGAALSEPYGFFAGPYLHTLSLSYRAPFHLKKILQEFTFEPYQTIDSSTNLVIYQITGSQPGQYPAIQNLKFSPRRIDYAEPLTWLWRQIHRSL